MKSAIHLVEIVTQIVVDEDIAKPGKRSSVDFRMTLHALAQPLAGLGHRLEIPKNRVLDEI